MTVTTLVSVKGAPGVTTLACLVAATWPDDRQVAVVESDPFGGDLAARFQLPTAWGWSSYLTASRRSESDVPVEEHLQVLPGGLDVMVLPAGDRRLVDGSSVDALLRSVHAPEASPWDLVVDGGRLAATPCTPATPVSAVEVWLDRSDRVLVVTRRDPPSVLKVREQAEALRGRCDGRVGLIVVGRGPHDTASIAAFTGIPVLAAVPDDPVAARMVAGAPGNGRALSRSLLVASARRLAGLVSVTPDGTGDPATSVDRGDQVEFEVRPPTETPTHHGLWGLLGRVGRVRVWSGRGAGAVAPTTSDHPEPPPLDAGIGPVREPVSAAAGDLPPDPADLPRPGAVR